jgi:site-specific DNA recombinase
MNSVIYVRQSLDRDGLGAAVERQLTECHALAEQLGLSVEHEYVDNDVSASKGVRPEFTKLLAAVRAGTVSNIIVWHTDRLYRRVRDLVELVELAETHALRIRTVKAGEYDLDSPAGRMLAQMLGAAARYEVEQKGARQVAANQQRATAGVWQFSNRPYGYQRIDGAVQIVEHEAAVLREAYERYIAGETFYAIATSLNERDVPTLKGGPWTITQLRDRLQNPAYAGMRLYKGALAADGNWEPIISGQTWSEFTAARSKRKTRHGWSNKTKYLLSGLAVCGVCGSRMMARPEYSRAKNVTTKTSRMTYQCTSNWCVSRDLNRVDEIVEATLLERLSRTDALELLTPHVDVTPMVFRSQEIRARRDDLATALADGVLTLAAVREQSARLEAELSSLQQQIANAAGGSQLSAVLLADSVERHWCDVLTIAQKREVLSALMSVTIRKQDNPRVFNPEDVAITWRA